jgi:hypothetical protein
MDAATRALVRERADNRCEYCLLRQEYCEFTDHIEHIVSKQHGGRDTVDNLALACHRCNLKKGPNLTGVDPETGELAPLFHPPAQPVGRALRVSEHKNRRAYSDPPRDSAGP